MLSQDARFGKETLDPVDPKVDPVKSLTGYQVKAADLTLCLFPDLLGLRSRILRISLFIDDRCMLIGIFVT